MCLDRKPQPPTLSLEGDEQTVLLQKLLLGKNPFFLSTHRQQRNCTEIFLRFNSSQMKYYANEQVLIKVGRCTYVCDPTSTETRRRSSRLRERKRSVFILLVSNCSKESSYSSSLMDQMCYQYFFQKIVLYTIGKSNQDGRDMITILLVSNCSKGSSNHTPLAYWICYQCYIISKTGSLCYGLKEKNIKNLPIVITCKQLRYMQKNKTII